MTHRCFVAGSPITHSRSPLIHGHWITERGLDATYKRLEITPDQLPELLAKVRDGTYLGGNLTIPLKQAVVPLLDQLTADAETMGAVNTVFLSDGVLTGANTDVAGFFAHLDLTCPGWDAIPASVLLLGAGGAARAILHGLKSRNIRDIRVANRSMARVRTLLDELIARNPKGCPVNAVAWPAKADVIADCDLVINATSLGMQGQPPLDLVWPVPLRETIAYDIVYSPLITPFLRDAAESGVRIVDGLGMLLHQASLAFGYWFGTVPEVTSQLRLLIEADLAPKVAIGP